MSKPLYICFEGLDGAGKSTVYKRVMDILEQQGYRVQGICPTQTTCYCESKVACQCHSLEKLFNRYPKLHQYRFLRLFLYAYRSNYAAKHIDQSSDLILGDRSLITSYVCRWHHCNMYNRLLVFIVNRLEYKIPAPDYVIYLKVPQKVLHERLVNRGNIDIDETEDRSRAMEFAYDILRTRKGIIKRIAHTKWCVINGDQSEENVCRDAIFQIVQLITNSTRINMK
ncbi:MAG: deoxynucleoside kinase [Lachnospiraceae bacterium]|nr:deoxynucleoside kinase [Lachnospiraceae bacterium]